jgi:type IV secretory pathway TrbF-like protein
MDVDVPVVTEEEELARSQEAYAVADWHDARAEQQASRWFWLALLMLVTNVGIGVYDHLWPREVVSAFVQPIRVTDDHQVTLIEPLKPMREYVMPPEAIMHMLVRFVVDLRRLGKDEVDQVERQNQVLAHTCGAAEKLVARPPIREAALIAVHVRVAPMALGSPQTYRVEWVESYYDQRGLWKGDHPVIGDFTLRQKEVDWKKADAMANWIRNPTGLCVSAFTIHEQPAS